MNWIKKLLKLSCVENSLRRNMYLMNYILACLLLFSSCGDGGVEDIIDDNENFKIIDGRVVISPIEYYNAIRNPMKGFREYFNPAKDKKRSQYPYPYGTMIKEYMQWDNMEDVASDGVEKVIEYSNHRWEGVEDINMKVIPRAYIIWKEPWLGGMTTNPEDPDDLRGSHWPSDIPGEVYSEDPDTPITGGYFVPTFQDRVKKFVKKLGEAWNNDPRVAYVEMGIIGCWGEQHDPNITTYWLPHTQDYHVANRTWIPGIEKTLGDAFTEAFPNKKVMVRYAYDFKDYEFGIFWDSWAMQQEQVRGYAEMKKLGDRWKMQPIGGEITWNWGNLSKFNSLEEVVADGDTRDLIIDQIRDLHCNHLGGVTWADFSDAEFISNAITIQKAMGYRFIINEFNYPTKIESNSPFSISFEIKNTGSSPFYYNWPVEISLLDPDSREKVWSTQLDDVEISTWMPGNGWDFDENEYTIEAENYLIEEELTIDEDIPDGKYIISIAILDPAGMLPSVRFAAYNYFNGGNHPMGYIGLNQDLDEFEIPITNFDDLQKDTSLKYIIEN